MECKPRMELRPPRLLPVYLILFVANAALWVGGAWGAITLFRWMAQ